MRGKAVNPCIAGNPCRITPAYAGKSRHMFHRSFPPADHPRLCGEKMIAQDHVHYSIRITPAYAGKRSKIPSQAAYMRDHPRLCGEKLMHQSSEPFLKGSPPPMRGKGPIYFERFAMWRITPAYAGKRSASRGHVETVRDHPRLCGEKNQGKEIRIPDLGSPPPMRGKAFL